VEKIDRKIIISVIIGLLGIVAVSGVLFQNREEIPPVVNITVNETRVTPNETRVIPNKTQVTPNETRIHTNISKEEAMRIAEEVPDLGPPIRGEAVNATLLRWRYEYMKHWRYPGPIDRYRTWVWNVTVRHPARVFDLSDGEWKTLYDPTLRNPGEISPMFYSYTLIDAQTGETFGFLPDQ